MSAYKPEHAVDLDTGAILAAPVHPGDAGDTRTVAATLEAAAGNLATVDLAPTPDLPAEVFADKGYHAREVLKRLADGPWRTRIAEPARRSVRRWHGDTGARRAVYANRARLLSGVARVALLLRAVLCERAFAHLLDRGGMCRTWLRGRDNVAKRYLVQVAGYNLALLMRALLGGGTAKAATDLRLFWRAAGAARAGPAPEDRIDRRRLGPDLPGCPPFARTRSAGGPHRHAGRVPFINALLN